METISKLRGQKIRKKENSKAEGKGEVIPHPFKNKASA
jgi:hypothetical protein